MSFSMQNPAYQNLKLLRDELVGGFKQEKNGQY